MKYGANTFIWASPFSTAAHLGLLDHVARLGFDVIEVAFEDPALIDLGALGGRAADVGLGVLVCGAYGPGRNLVSDDPAERAATAAYVRTLIEAEKPEAPTNLRTLAKTLQENLGLSYVGMLKFRWRLQAAPAQSPATGNETPAARPARGARKSSKDRLTVVPAPRED